MFRFENLTGWQRAIEFADSIYTAAEAFPSEEKFGLTSQLRRAAVSISSNVAEGCGRSTDADQARFVEIAYGPLMESVSRLHITRRRGYVRDQAFQTLYFQTLYTTAEEPARILSGLRSHVKGR